MKPLRKESALFTRKSSLNGLISWIFAKRNGQMICNQSPSRRQGCSGCGMHPMISLRKGLQVKLFGKRRHLKSEASRHPKGNALCKLSTAALHKLKIA